MPKDIQRLRCKVNFQALTFVPHIRAHGKALVNHRRYPSQGGEVSTNCLEEVCNSKNKKGASKFVVLHLRFDKYMAVRSAYDFGRGKAGSSKESTTHLARRVVNSQFTDQGRCPLTLEEIGLLLAALGLDNGTLLISCLLQEISVLNRCTVGKPGYQTLRDLFPLVERKSLASLEERAVVDDYVTMHRDIFISASPGNMHNAVKTGGEQGLNGNVGSAFLELNTVLA